MKLVFTKMHVLNNEFIVINGIKQTFKPNAKLIRQWADRHSGIGFDQLLLIEKSRKKKRTFIIVFSMLTVMKWLSVGMVHFV